MDVDAPAAPAEGEADITKEGKPAEVGEKRERPDDAAAQTNGEEKTEPLVQAEEDAGKETKKARTDDAEGGANTDADAAPAAGLTDGAAEPLAEDAAPADGDEKPAKRGPGRPPKSKGAVPAAASTAEGSEPKKRGPGRPRKGTNSKDGDEAGKGDDAEPAASTATRRSTRSRPSS